MTLREYNAQIREETHSTHLEDCILKGPDHAKRMINFFRKCFFIIEGSHFDGPPVSVKWDGAPAVTMFTSVKGLSDVPGVSTKSLFNATPKYYTSDEEIDADNRGEGLSVKLKMALRLAKERIIPVDQVWQGDLLWIQGDQKQDVDDDTTVIFVRPNTLAYATPLNSDLGRKIATSDIGIVFHTRYRGTIGTWTQSNDISISEAKNIPEWAFVVDAQLPNLQGKVSLSGAESDELKQMINELDTLVSDILDYESYEELTQNSEFIDFYVMTLQNNKVDKGIKIDPDEFVEDLHKWINGKMHKQFSGLDKLKTKVGRDKKRTSISTTSKELHAITRDNEELIAEIAQALYLAAEIKAIIIDQFEQANDWMTRVESRTNGMTATRGEGFVVSDAEGYFVKLVDRSAFSKFNRDPDIVKGFETANRISESEEKPTEDVVILAFDSEEEAEEAVADINETARDREVLTEARMPYDEEEGEFGGPQGGAFSTKGKAEEYLTYVKNKYSGIRTEITGTSPKFYVKIEKIQKKDDSTEVKASQPSASKLSDFEKAKAIVTKSKSSLSTEDLERKTKAIISVLNKLANDIATAQGTDKISTFMANPLSKASDERNAEHVTDLKARAAGMVGTRTAEAQPHIKRVYDTLLETGLAQLLKFKDSLQFNISVKVMSALMNVGTYSIGDNDIEGVQFKLRVSRSSGDGDTSSVTYDVIDEAITGKLYEHFLNNPGAKIEEVMNAASPKFLFKDFDESLKMAVTNKWTDSSGNRDSNIGWKEAIEARNGSNILEVLKSKIKPGGVICLHPYLDGSYGNENASQLSIELFEKLYRASGVSQKDSKNPADVYLVSEKDVADVLKVVKGQYNVRFSKSGDTILKPKEKDGEHYGNLSSVTEELNKLYASGTLIGISLKKPFRRTAHIKSTSLGEFQKRDATYDKVASYFFIEDEKELTSGDKPVIRHVDFQPANTNEMGGNRTNKIDDRAPAVGAIINCMFQDLSMILSDASTSEAGNKISINVKRSTTATKDGSRSCIIELSYPGGGGQLGKVTSNIKELFVEHASTFVNEYRSVVGKMDESLVSMFREVYAKTRLIENELEMYGADMSEPISVMKTELGKLGKVISGINEKFPPNPVKTRHLNFGFKNSIAALILMYWCLTTKDNIKSAELSRTPLLTFINNLTIICAAASKYKVIPNLDVLKDISGSDAAGKIAFNNDFADYIKVY